MGGHAARALPATDEPMSELVTPHKRYRASFLAAQAELGEHAKIRDDAAFAALLVDIAAARVRVPTATRVPSTTLWLVDAEGTGRTRAAASSRQTPRHDVMTTAGPLRAPWEPLPAGNTRTASASGRTGTLHSRERAFWWSGKEPCQAPKSSGAGGSGSNPLAAGGSVPNRSAANGSSVWGGGRRVEGGRGGRQSDVLQNARDRFGRRDRCDDLQAAPAATAVENVIQEHAPYQRRPWNSDRPSAFARLVRRWRASGRRGGGGHDP